MAVIVVSFVFILIVQVAELAVVPNCAPLALSEEDTAGGDVLWQPRT